jgi:hypothetical protein
MTGWVSLGAGLLTLFQVWWYEPHGLARTRMSVVQRGKPHKFDAFLGSRWYRLSKWARVGAGLFLVALGVMIMDGIW